MATYSLSLAGAPADNPTRPQSLDVDDAYATPGGMSGAMANGTPFLCRGPDGQEAYYKYDAERSLPGGPRVLLKVS